MWYINSRMLVRSGQITVLVLLLSLLGLTTALSVASRSLSDLKQVTRVDIGTKTFAASEAGLEFALNDLFQNQTADCTTKDALASLPSLSSQMKSITYTLCANNADYAMQLNVSKDDVFQIDFVGIPGNLKTADVLWSNSAASVLVDVVDTSNIVIRYYYNSVGSSLTNGFSVGTNIATGCLTTTCNDPSFASWVGCAPGIPNIPNVRLIRIKPVYANSSVAICGRSAGGSPGRLNVQFVVITVTATSTDGTVKKIQATRVQPALSPVFDNTLYTGGTIVK